MAIEPTKPAGSLSFRPPKGVVKYLLVSPTGFAGEVFLEDRLLLTHAFPITNLEEQLAHPALAASGYSRAFYVLGFPLRSKSTSIGNDAFAEQIVSALSVFFGKRFDNLGIIELDGIHALPLFQGRIVSKFLEAGIWNNDPRADCDFGFRSAGRQLELQSFGTLAEKFLAAEDDKKWRFFLNSASFYLSALRLCNVDLEKAYLDLVMALEVLAGYFTFSDKDLFEYDADLAKLFSDMEKAGLGGRIDFVKARLFQIKRRVMLSVQELVTQEFFDRSEAKEPQYALKRDLFPKHISSAYELRSKYVHKGTPIGHLVQGLTQFSAEVNVGEIEGDLKKLHAQCPTFLGLERLVRFVLLRFICESASISHPHLHGTSINKTAASEDGA
ncbi:MAG: hypothetical protein HS116_23720 [Planctomycetes bacterium]|nr:hypothetical protein [Planctomycetota bacterium]